MTYRRDSRPRLPAPRWDPFTPEHRSDPERTDGARAWDVLATLRRNLKLTIAICALTVAPIGYFVLTEPPSYTAEGLIRLVDARRALTGGIEGAAMENVIGAKSDAIRSQIAVLRGRVVLGDVVDRTGLRLVWASDGIAPGLLAGTSTAPGAESDTIRLHFGPRDVVATARGGRSTAAYGDPLELAGASFTIQERPAVPSAELLLIPRGIAIDRLGEALVTEPQAMTDAVLLSYRSDDPVRAREVVNTLISTFQHANADAAQQQSRRRRIFLEEQLAGADSLLSEAQLALSRFRSRERVYSSSDKLVAQQQGLMTLEARREEVAADRRMYEALFAQLQQQRASGSYEALRTLVSSPGIASNPVISQLYFQLTHYEASRDSLMSGSLGATLDHPEVQRLTSRISLTRTNLVDAVRSHLASLDARVEALGELVQRNAAEIAVLPAAEAEEFRLMQQMETTRKVADQLREELYRARMAEAVEAGQVEVVYPAPLPLEPIDTGKGFKLAFGMVIGLLFGTGGAFLRERMNTSIRRRDELESALRIPGLAVIPSIGVARPHRWISVGASARNGEGDTLVAVDRVHSLGAEAYRTLRTNLLFSHEMRAFRSVVVTSAGSGEGKTTTAANLAASLAQQGRRVVLVDCDLRRARLHQVFRIPREPGLTELLTGERELVDILVATGVPNLAVIPSGALPPNPSELLGSPEVRAMMQDLTEFYDVVVLDSPPLLATSDAAVLSAVTDGAIMVVRAGHTDRSAAQDAVRQLQAVGARVVGAVLNDPDSTVPSYERYYGRYHSEYYAPTAVGA